MKAVIFDFDGLMLDSESPAYFAWSAIYREHGAELSLPLWVECVGASHARFDPVAHLESLTGKTHDRAALVSDKDRRKRDECSRLGLLPGVEQLMREARGMGLKLAVASSSSSAWVRGHLQRLGIEASFDVIKTGDDVKRVKPFPDLYVAAAEALGEKASNCLVFEDSLNGVRAAKAAGMRCYAIPNFVTKGLDFTEANGLYGSLADISLAQLIL